MILLVIFLLKCFFTWKLNLLGAINGERQNNLNKQSHQRIQHGELDTLSLGFKKTLKIHFYFLLDLELTLAVLLKLGELGWAQTHPATVTHLACCSVCGEEGCMETPLISPGWNRKWRCAWLASSQVPQWTDGKNVVLEWGREGMERWEGTSAESRWNGRGATGRGCDLHCREVHTRENWLSMNHSNLQRETNN